MNRPAMLTTAMLLMAALSHAPVWAIGGSLVGSQAYLLRLRGYVGSAPTDARVLGPLTIGVDSKTLTLQLTEVQTLNGPVSEGISVLRAFDLYDPNLLFIGDAKLTDQVRQAATGAYLTVYGHVVGEQRLLLVEVDPRGPN